MLFIKDHQFFKIAILAMILSLAACTPGLQSGDINATFTGVNGVSAVSPTAVNLSWRKTDGFSTYDVYANYQQEPVVSGVSDSALIENLQPSTLYKFKVTGKGENVGTVGGDREMNVETWPRFTGISSVKKNEAGNLVVSWDYDYPALEFFIYYDEEKAPTAESTNQWADVKATTSSHSYTFSNLKKSVRYYFVVQVRYRGSEYERPTKSLSERMDSSFPTPSFELSPITIGTLPSIFVSPVINDVFLAKNYSTRIYKDDVIASDPLVGSGQVSFSSTFNLQLGKVDNIALKVTYNDGKINETVSLTGLSTYLKGITDFIDLPAQSLAGTGQAFIGESMTVGDFNCDGYDDLAVGLPRASLAGEGSNSLQTGAVYVYYGGYQRSDNRYVLKTEAVVPGLYPSRTPAIPGVDPQIITLDDLSYQAQFGKSVSGRGNLNGDTRGAYSCDDLVVGAPMVTPQIGVPYVGAAFVFFGSPEGLKAPRTMAAMAQNTATCDGRPSGANCTAVMLWANTSLWPASEFGGTPFADTYINGKLVQAAFGYSVSYIGDFNADGYDDIAIGAPNDIWSGKPPIQSANPNWYLMSVGSVYIYFGSKFGIGKEVPTTSGNQMPFVKIYPPVVQAGMKFGYSIAGGVDVNGGYRVKAVDNTFKGGADFVVGAPYFYYAPPSSLQLAMTATGDPNQDQNITPGDGGWWGTQSQTAATSPRFGFSQSSSPPATNLSPGAAFVYFGRSRITQASAVANVDNDDSPVRSTFWKCGSRGMDTIESHFSCLAHKDSFRMLFPRNGSTYNFGKSVAMIGMKSVRDANDALICAIPAGGPPTPPAAAGCTDPNGDGYGEILVSAPESNASNPTRSISGVIWQFFGNPQDLFEAGAGASDNFKSGSPYYNTTANCSNFSLPATAPGNFTTDKSVCAPTMLIPNSILSNTRLGFLPPSLAVGDLNGDGLLDLAVGAEQDDTKAVNSGAVYAFLSVSGQGVTNNYKKFILDNGKTSDFLGRSVAIGNFDVGATNYNDLIVGAPQDKSQRPGGGAVYQFLSGGAPLAAVRTTADYVTYDYAAAAQQYEYGNARIVGDVNGDGYDDAVTHISGYDNTGTRSFDAVVNFGSPIGLITTSFCLKNLNRIFKAGSASASECYPAKTHNTSLLADDFQLPQLIVKSNNISYQWAQIAFAIGDVNGDGYADVMFSDPGGQHVIYYGTRGGLQDTVAPAWLPSTNDPQLLTFKVPLGQYSYRATNPNYDDQFNVSAPVIFGDFNGDGFADIVIGNPSQQGPTMPAGTPKLNGDPGTILSGQRWACSASDTTNPDCIAGTGPKSHGAVTIYYGSRRGVQTPSVAGAALGTDTDIASPSIYFKDFYNSETTDNQKACTGSAGGNLCVPGFLRNPVFENVSYGFDRLDHGFGLSVTVMDIDKDGYDDLLVGAPGFEQLSCFGITDPDDPDYRRNTGRVYIYKGSQFGILAGAPREYYRASYNTGALCSSITPADDTGTGVVTNTKLRALSMPMASWDPYDRQTLEQNNYTAARYINNLGAFNFRSRENRSFGLRVVNIGDVNGDGYEDLAVTAPYEANLNNNNQVVFSSGAIYIYYGPLCGTDNDDQVTSYIQSLSKVNLSTKYANNLTDPSISTVSLKAECKAKPLAPQKIYIKDVTHGENFGLSLIGGRAKGGIATGDVNLDGYTDLVVGAPNSTETISGTLQNGRGVVFFGSSTGIFADDFPATAYEITADRKVKPYLLQPPILQNGSRFFRGNLSAGDVNGDKAMDVMIPSLDYDVKVPDPGIDVGTFFMFY